MLCCPNGTSADLKNLSIEMEITKKKISIGQAIVSKDFKIHTLGYGFLFGNHKHLQKSQDFWFEDFFLQIFKIHRLA